MVASRSNFKAFLSRSFNNAGNLRENHPTLAGQDTRNQKPADWLVTNLLPASFGRWWQDSSSYGKVRYNLGRGACRPRSARGPTDESGCRWG